MAVSDPMLKRLKQYVLELRMAQENNEYSEVTDSHPKLQSLCEVLEDIFRRGLKKSYFSLKKNAGNDYWNMFDTLPSLCDTNGKQKKQGMGFHPYFPLNPVFNLCLEEVRQNNRTLTSQGKGRLMLRHLLQKRLIVWPIEALKDMRCVHDFYDDLYSIIGNEILREILLSLLMELVKVKMGNLCLKNANFLDDTWALPIYKELEFVPCKLLGLDLVCVNGLQVINGLLSGSVAEENQLLERGDVLDELYGVPLRNTRLLLRDIMKSHAGQPVSISVVKVRQEDNSLYSPLIRVLQQSNTSLKQHFQWKAPVNNDDDDELLDSDNSTYPRDQLPIHARLDSDFPDDVPAQNPDMYPSYIVKYVGKTDTGTDGSVAQIESAVARVLAENNDPNAYQLVQLILGEKDVSILRYNKDQGPSDPPEIVLQPSYPMISSCGRRVDCQNFFAYIAGESTCTISRHFVCFVFQARNEMQARTVLCAIAQGFERTHWAL